jgi:hypothetical protein
MSNYSSTEADKSLFDEQQAYHRWASSTSSMPPHTASYSYHVQQAPQSQQQTQFPLFLDSSLPSQRLYTPQRQTPPNHQRNGSVDSTLNFPTSSYYVPATTLPQPIQAQQTYSVNFPEIPGHYMYPRRQSPVSSLTPANDAHAVRESRSASFNSTGPFPADASHSASQSDFSRGGSPSISDLSSYGYLNVDGTWSCAFPGCTSRATFTRGCDLRKHYKRHTKSLFCRHEGCPQATEGGFSSKKDRARHEAKHNPGILCEWDGCERVFSRVDNMVCIPVVPQDPESRAIS